MTYQEIAKKRRMNEYTTKIFVAYMKARWGDSEKEHINCSTGYANEWAKIFNVGMEFVSSDATGREILRKIDPERYRM